MTTEAPLLIAARIDKRFGAVAACRAVSFELYPGEVVGVVGESGSGKTTLLNILAGRLRPDSGRVLYTMRDGAQADIHALSEPRLRLLMRTDLAFVHQNPRDGLRLAVSAGANVGERLMAVGARHYGDIRGEALGWLGKVEIDGERLDDLPRTFSGGMQQRLQIARNLVTGPRLVFMDEPTGGLDVSVQAKLLDLLRSLVARLGLSVVIVTHDLAVARLLAHRLMVMRRGVVVETGLTDQVLDDPQHEYTQLLVSSVLHA
jgi:putative phosphonate transport system ATP-binding protein